MLNSNTFQRIIINNFKCPFYEHRMTKYDNKLIRRPHKIKFIGLRKLRKLTGSRNYVSTFKFNANFKRKQQ